MGVVRPHQEHPGLGSPTKPSHPDVAQQIEHREPCVVERPLESLKEPPRQCGTHPTGRCGEHQRALAGNGRKGERAITRIVGRVDPDGVRFSTAGNGNVDRWVVGASDDEALADDVIPLGHGPVSGRRTAGPARRPRPPGQEPRRCRRPQPGSRANASQAHRASQWRPALDRRRDMDHRGRTGGPEAPRGSRTAHGDHRAAAPHPPPRAQGLGPDRLRCRKGRAARTDRAKTELWSSTMFRGAAADSTPLGIDPKDHASEECPAHDLHGVTYLLDEHTR